MTNSNQIFINKVSKVTSEAHKFIKAITFSLGNKLKPRPNQTLG